ncbi:MAG: hypothetical protein KIH67_001720 [Candidatus Moranbacteria bacterium]|nr:hypothetical protein [Candidatus Moranbacteria bacterium]
MSTTYLHALVAEVDAISDEDLAGQLTRLPKPGESETILGRASPKLLQLHALFGMTIDAANAAADQFNAARGADEPNVEELERLDKEHSVLKKKLKTLEFAFWQSVAAEYLLPEDASGYAIRAEGDIVAMPKQNDGMHFIAIDISGLFGGGGSDDPLGRLFGDLFGRHRGRRPN